MQKFNTENHKKYLWSTLTIFVILVGIFLRFYGLDRESLWSDELFTVAAALDVGSNTHWLSFTPKVIQELTFDDSFLTWKAADNTPPLFELTLIVWSKLFGTSDFALRALPALFSSLSLIVFYMGLKSVIPPKSLLFGTIIFAISVPSIIYSQEVRAYSLTAFLCTIALTRLIKHILDSDNRKHKLWPDILIFILMAYSHYTGLYMAGLFAGIYMLFISLPQRKYSDAARFLIVPLALLPWMYLSKKAFLFSSAGGYGWREYHASDIFDLMLPGTLNFFLPSAGIVFALMWIFCIFIALLKNDPSQGWIISKNSLTSKLKEKPISLSILFLVCVSLLFFYSIYNSFTSKMWHPRYLLVVLPVVVASFTLLLHASSIGKKFIFIAVTCVFTYFSFSELKTYYGGPSHKEDYRAASKFISDEIMDSSLIILGWKPNEAYYRHYLTKHLSKNEKKYSIIAVSSSEDIDNICKNIVSSTKNIFIFQHESHSFNAEMKKCNMVELSNSYSFRGLTVEKYQLVF